MKGFGFSKPFIQNLEILRENNLQSNNATTRNISAKTVIALVIATTLKQNFRKQRINTNTYTLLIHTK
jgi:hypothetical protein